MRKFWEEASIRTRLLVQLLPIVVVGLMILTGAIYNHVDNTMRRQILSEAINNIEKTSQYITVWAGNRVEGNTENGKLDNNAMDKIRSKVQSLRLGDHGYSVMVDRDGTYISHPESAKVGNANYKDESDRALIQLGDYMISTRSGLYEFRDANGDEMLAIYYPVTDTYWGMATVGYKDEIFEPVTTTLQIMLGISALLLAVIVICMSLSISRITSPIKDVVAEVGLLAEGDFRQRAFTGGSGGEISMLKEAVETMRSQVAKTLSSVHDSANNMAVSTEKMTDTTDQCAMTAKRVANSINAVADSSVMQLKAVDSASNAMDQFNISVQDISSKTVEAVEKGRNASRVAREGGQMLDKAIAQIKTIEESSAATAEKVIQLGKRSEEIGDIVDTITAIAGQTNLLALNAAIEAARAGEQGRGFAVVAGEVRKLAESSQEAAQHIGLLIQDIQEDTNKAVKVMEKGSALVSAGTASVKSTGEAFRNIITIVDDVSAEMEKIRKAMDNMVASGNIVEGNVMTISEASHNTSKEASSVSAASGEQTEAINAIAEASQELAAIAVELKDKVNGFKL